MNAEGVKLNLSLIDEWKPEFEEFIKETPPEERVKNRDDDTQEILFVRDDLFVLKTIYMNDFQVKFLKKTDSGHWRYGDLVFDKDISQEELGKCVLIRSKIENNVLEEVERFCRDGRIRNFEQFRLMTLHYYFERRVYNQQVAIANLLVPGLDSAKVDTKNTYFGRINKVIEQTQGPRYKS